MKKFFYIIHRDGQIFEIENIGDRFTSSMELWQQGGIVIFPTLGVGLNTNDITKIFNEEQYESFTYNVKPKMFIKNGTWYDGQERKFIRNEKWKQEEIDNIQKIEQKSECTVDPKEVRKLIEKYRPNF